MPNNIESGDKTYLCISSGVVFIVLSDTNVPLRVEVGKSGIWFQSYGQEDKGPATIPSILTIKCVESELHVFDDEYVENFTATRAQPVGSEEELFTDDVDFYLKLDDDTEIYVVSEKSKVYINAAGKGGKEGGEYGASFSRSARAVEYAGTMGRNTAESLMRWKMEDERDESFIREHRDESSALVPIVTDDITYTRVFPFLYWIGLISRIRKSQLESVKPE